MMLFLEVILLKLHSALDISYRCDFTANTRTHTPLLTMVRSTTLYLALHLLACFVGSTLAWVPSMNGVVTRTPMSSTSGVVVLRMALNYNDPVVGQELAKVQPMSFEEVEAELAGQGIRVSQAMNEMDVKLMCVEMRLRKTGQVGKQKNKQAPTKFSSKFEELVWTKPAFKEFYETVKQTGDPNALNVVTEYINDKANAVQRYGKDYKALIRQTEQAMTAPAPVKTPTLSFSGFPANMGEQACRMTLASIGAISDFSCVTDEDFPVLKGKVTFENIEDAKKAVAKYDGMDMGMGTKLELKSV